MPVLLLSWFQKQMQMGTAKCAFRSFAQGAQPSTQSHPGVFQKPVLIATPAVPKSIETPTTVLFLKCQLRASPGNHQQPEPFPLFCVAGHGARMLPDFILFFSFFCLWKYIFLDFTSSLAYNQPPTQFSCLSWFISRQYQWSH